MTRIAAFNPRNGHGRTDEKCHAGCTTWTRYWSRNLFLLRSSIGERFLKSAWIPFRTQQKTASHHTTVAHCSFHGKNQSAGATLEVHRLLISAKLAFWSLLSFWGLSLDERSRLSKLKNWVLRNIVVKRGAPIQNTLRGGNGGAPTSSRRLGWYTPQRWWEEFVVNVLPEDAQSRGEVHFASILK